MDQELLEIVAEDTKEAVKNLESWGIKFKFDKIYPWNIQYARAQKRVENLNEEELKEAMRRLGINRLEIAPEEVDRVKKT